MGHCPILFGTWRRPVAGAGHRAAGANGSGSAERLNGVAGMARLLMDEHGLTGWTLTFGEARKRLGAGIVKLTHSSSIDPQDAELQPVVNPPCWASKTAVSFNLTIPRGVRPSWFHPPRRPPLRGICSINTSHSRAPCIKIRRMDIRRMDDLGTLPNQKGVFSVYKALNWPKG